MAKESNAINDFKEKKLVEHLYDGAKVLILFGHGLGDTIMFYPAYEALVRLYPKVDFTLYVESGQEEIFGKVEWDEDAYDLVFSLNYFMAENSGVTKSEHCCERELGIDSAEIKSEFAQLSSFDSPLVGVHFQGTALPQSVNCDERTARQIWNEILGAGLVPIEVHYQHMFHNPMNVKYPCVTSTVRGCSARISSLIGLLQRCRCFIGVASGPLTLALSMYPDRVLYLQKEHDISSYTKEKVAIVDLKGDYINGSVSGWLGSIMAKSEPELQPESESEQEEDTAELQLDEDTGEPVDA